MSKAVISNRIYMDLPPNKKELFDALTYEIVKESRLLKHGEQKEIIRMYKMISPTIVSIPQGRSDLIPSNYEIIDKRIVEFADFPAPKHPLFPAQQVVYDDIKDSSFINALVGWGKTFTALHVASKLGMKTLVVVHTAALRDQWIEEVEELFGFVPDTIGNGKFGLSTPIVVGNIQSLTKKVPEIAKTFGTIIMDEAHHTPASTFLTLIDQCHARYRIALSGTMTRKDGKHILFRDVFGSKLYQPPQNNTLNPSIKLLKTNIKLPYGKTWADKVTGLLSDPDYQAFIAATACVKANEGHKVLVIGDRIDFLEAVHKLTADRSALITGATKERKDELEKVAGGTHDIMVGSRSIFSEGISLNALSCLILSTPMVNPATIEQVIGRIMRLSDGKLNPEVIDIQFAGHAEKTQNALRLGLYLQKGWEVEYI